MRKLLQISQEIKHIFDKILEYIEYSSLILLYFLHVLTNSNAQVSFSGKSSDCTPASEPQLWPTPLATVILFLRVPLLKKFLLYTKSVRFQIHPP
jgi:hypothetical protein